MEGVSQTLMGHGTPRSYSLPSNISFKKIAPETGAGAAVGQPSTAILGEDGGHCQ